MGWPVRVVRLAAEPLEGGLWCGPDGLTLAGRPLLERTGKAFSPRSLPELQDAFDAAYGSDGGLEAAAYVPGLIGIARSLSKGDIPLAMIGSLLLKLPEVPGPHTGWAAANDDDTKHAFDDDQPRDENGRWTANGASEAKQPAPPTFTEPAVATETESLASIAPKAISLLGRLAAVISAPVAFAAGLLVPSNGSNIHEGALPGLPGLTYRSDEGIVTISRLDDAGNIETLYRAAPDADGFYHDAEGEIIGRHVGTGVLFDPDALAQMAGKTDKPPETGADDTAGPATTAAQDDDEPQVCPPPTIENITKRSARSLAYQSQITGLPIGFDMEYRGVRFDGCDDTTGRMIEAKGLGLEWLLNKPYSELIQTKFYVDMMDQARRQNEASAGRGDDYYFAEERVGAFFETEFRNSGYSNIVVHHVEAIVKKIEDCIDWVRRNLDAWRRVRQVNIIGVIAPSNERGISYEF
jgi:hypothetical protein